MYLSDGIELCLKVDGVVYSLSGCLSGLLSSEDCDALEMFAYGVRSYQARRKELEDVKEKTHEEK